METTDVGDEPSSPQRIRRAMRMPGDFIGQWRVERTLGAGAMGVVYAARDPDTGRRAAIKVLHPRPQLVHKLLVSLRNQTRILKRKSVLVSAPTGQISTVFKE